MFGLNKLSGSGHIRVLTRFDSVMDAIRENDSEAYLKALNNNHETILAAVTEARRTIERYEKQLIAIEAALNAYHYEQSMNTVVS